MPIDPRRLVVGDRVPGTKWVVCRKLGAGGMGVVFEVVKPPGIRGAMKIMLPHLAARREFVESFLAEVRVTASLDHRNVVRVTDFEEIEDGTLYYVMELLNGSTLRQTMELHREPLKPPIVYEIIKQVCSGLERAHESGVVHRDLKPENVFLHAPEGDDATVKVGDFGIAVLYRDERVRGVNGTPKYMAPEQFLDQRVSPRTDVYALGLMTYEMLTGRFPFDLPKEVKAMREVHLKSAPMPASRFLPTLSREVDALLLSALAKRPEERPSSAIEYSNRLFDLSFCQGLTTPANVNATEPTFETLAGLVRRQGEGGSEGGAGHPSLGGGTFRGMTPPPVDGRSLELAPVGAAPIAQQAAVPMQPMVSSVAHVATPTVPSANAGAQGVWNVVPPPAPPAAAPFPGANAPGIGQTPLPPPSAAGWAPAAPRAAQVTARYGVGPGTYSPPHFPSSYPSSPQRSDAGMSNSVADRSAHDPVVTISRRAMYRTLIVAPILAFAAVVLVLVLMRVHSRATATSNPSPVSAPAADPGPFPQPAASTRPAVAITPTPAVEVPSSVAAATASTTPVASVVVAVPVGATMPAAVPRRPAPSPTITASGSKPAARPPRDDGRDLLPSAP
jgi:eukaryotic-like serine/threonine-protein kinase